MNRVHVECADEGAQCILSDPCVLRMEASDDDWVAALSVGKILRDLGLNKVQETAGGRGEDTGVACGFAQAGSCSAATPQSHRVSTVPPGA